MTERYRTDVHANSDVYIVATYWKGEFNRQEVERGRAKVEYLERAPDDGRPHVLIPRHIQATVTAIQDARGMWSINVVASILPMEATDAVPPPPYCFGNCEDYSIPCPNGTPECVGNISPGLTCIEDGKI